MDVVPLPLIYIAVGALGAIIGSFLNVVIHRLPLEESIVFPNSRCPKCEAAIKPYDNIPIFSWLVLLRGKCRNCKAPINARYPAVEALTGLLWTATFWHAGLTFALPFELIFVTAIIVLMFIDAEHQILPDKITYPLIVIAVIARITLPLLMDEFYFDDINVKFLTMFPSLPVWGVVLLGGLLGAIAGGVLLWVLGEVWKRVRGIDAMGLGDVKMMLGVGAFLGWRLTLLAIFLSSISGAVWGFLNIFKRILTAVNLRKKIIKKFGYGGYFAWVNRQFRIPFAYGVFLGIGSVIALLFGKIIINWYVTNFIP